MRIGILTFHCAHNYGAVLQCYALQETLKSLGHEVEVIDYRPKYLLNPYKKFNLRRLRRKNPVKLIWALIKEFLLISRRRKRYFVFQRFIDKHLNLSEFVEDRKIPDNYDAYVVGSDQVWNINITSGKFEPLYFADFVFLKEGRRYIAYAASMGKIYIYNEKTKQHLIKLLKSFDAISVRELELGDFLKPLVPNIDIQTVLDPTLLANPKIWDTIAVRPNMSSKYVVVYQVRNNENTIRIANDIARQINGEVIQLVAWLQLKNSNGMYQCASPKEFLGWIKYSDCVVTTSFHGTAFATIFQRPFYCIRLNDGADGRSDSLLRLLGLSNRMIDIDSTPMYEEVDYHCVNRERESQRERSLLFLTNALK